jgi:hypothetical protein
MTCFFVFEKVPLSLHLLCDLQTGCGISISFFFPLSMVSGVACCRLSDPICRHLTWKSENIPSRQFNEVGKGMRSTTYTAEKINGFKEILQHAYLIF